MFIDRDDGDLTLAEHLIRDIRKEVDLEAVVVAIWVDSVGVVVPRSCCW